MDPSLVVAFRRGWRWPLADDDEIEVFAPDSRLVARIPGRLIRLLIQQYMNQKQLDEAMAAQLREASALPPPTTAPARAYSPLLRGADTRRLRRPGGLP